MGIPVWFPSTIVTGRGRQFESHLWKNLMSFIGSKWARTTAYHPQTNGMVERFHRQLKCALKAQTNANLWIEVLPLVLLGIQTSLKEDISSTAAELVYGTTLCLPGEYFTPTTTESLPDPSNYVRQLKALMQHIHSSPPRQPTNNYGNILKGLATATHIFIRQDVVRKPLQPPYDGPFLVVKRTDKHYTVNING